MAKKYPTIGSKQSWRTGKVCPICGIAGTDQRIDIQVNWFRGDDDVIYVHAACAKGKTAAELQDAMKEFRRKGR